MTEPIAYFNGEYVPYSQAQLPLHDAGVVWGAIITDRVRTFRKQPFRLEEHLRRFINSCQLARVPLEKSATELTAITDEVLQRHRPLYENDQEFSLLFIATPGPLRGFAPIEVSCHPTLIVYALPIDGARFHYLWTHGAALCPYVATLGCDPAIKHRSRLPWWLAQLTIRSDEAAAEALFVTETGLISETPTSNIIAVIDRVLVSPPQKTILAGITLDVVQQLCVTLNIPFQERDLTLSELENCSEAILTNTSYCLAGVAKIDGKPLPFPGPVFQRLAKAWNELVGMEAIPTEKLL